MKQALIISIFVILTSVSEAYAQTTEFTYQGQMTNSSTPATGVFDFEFALFDTAFGGAQIGSTLTRSGVSVNAGIFSVNLDFGQAFPGGTRFLEIRVRQSGGGSYTLLSPRQPVSSAPYSIKSLNADSAQTAVNATNATNATNAANATTAANAITATSATTATTFTGPLAGDVTGTQTATTVARLQGRNVASAQPNNGQVLKFNSANSQWEPANDETASGGGGGTITGVTAGTGLTGGGTTGSVTLGIANGGVGPVQLADLAVSVNKIVDSNVTDQKILSVSGAKVTGAVATATNSSQLGGIAANQYVVTTDPRLTDSRAPTAGSTNYIQNQNAGPQASSNFNISGNGTAGGTLTASVMNVTSRYDISGERALVAAPGGNTFVGRVSGTTVNLTGTDNSFLGSGSGVGISSGSRNSYFGKDAGRDISTGNNNSAFGASAGRAGSGSGNSFFGMAAGEANTASRNSFFGSESGRANTSADDNAFFGYHAGTANIGGGNSFFGSRAGESNTSGNANAFFGNRAGASTTTGISNSFFGWEAGASNLTGQGNAFFGTAAGQGASTASSNSFFGFAAGANTTTSRNSFFGREVGSANVTGTDNTYMGYVAGDDATGSDNTFIGSDSGGSTTTGSGNTFVGRNAGDGNTTGGNNTTLGNGADTASGALVFATAIGAGATVSTSSTVVLGRSGGQDSVLVPGDLSVVNGGDVALGSGGILVVGTTAGANIAMDGNEIMARNAGGAATLALNASGGNVNLIQGGSGSVGIGTTTPGDKLDVDGDIRVGTSGTNGCLKNNNGGTITGVCSSDERFKRNISPFGSVLNNLSKLRPVHYFWRAKDFPNKHFGPDQTYGLLAQDVEKVLPELVSTDAQGFKQIDYGKLPMLTIQAVKELNEQNQTLKARVETQASEIAALKAAICGITPAAQLCTGNK
jgi:hypothetical protein